MKLGELIRRMGALAAAVTLVMTLPSPASADTGTAEGYFWGNSTTANSFYWRVDSNVFSDDNPLGHVTWGDAFLELGSLADVSATGCTISMWQQLFNPAIGYWESPHQQRDCKNVLDLRNTRYYYTTDRWDTSATAARGHFCVYLFYKNSSTAGWTRCRAGVWEYA
jgi:hypothetical protein